MDIGKNIREVRAEFPVLESKAYLNSAAHGPSLKRVYDASREWWKHRFSEDQVDPPDAGVEVARLLNVPTEEICWVNRVSQGLNIVSSMMKRKKGENIVVTDLGYQSNVYVWMPYRFEGIEIRRISNRDSVIDVSDFEKAIDDKTRVVSISEVEWTSGVRYPMREISEIAHDHGAYLVNDAYQAVGAVEVDVKSEDVDFFTFGSEKWLCCPVMIGVLYVKKSLHDVFQPTYMNYNNVEEAFRDGLPWEKTDHDNIETYSSALYPDARKYYRGCVSEEYIWGLHACLSYFNKLGAKQIQKRTAKLSQHLIEGLREHPVKVNTPEDPEKRGALVTYNTGSFEKNKRVHEELRKNDIIVAHRYAGGVGGIRVSCHFFNTKEEIDRLLEVQRRVLA
jgi:selenocysteine lyase/cysteine desulfurase